MKPDDQRLPATQGRRSQVAGRTGHGSDQFVVVGAFCLQIVFPNLTTLRDNQFLYTLQNIQDFGPGKNLLFCVLLLGNFTTMARKKLLRFRAGRSAATVVIPVDFRGGLGHDETPVTIAV